MNHFQIPSCDQTKINYFVCVKCYLLFLTGKIETFHVQQKNKIKNFLLNKFFAFFLFLQIISHKKTVIKNSGMLSSLYFQRKKRRFSMSLVFCPFVPMSYSSCCREVYKVSLVIVLMSSCIVVFISANPFLPRLMSFRLYSFENFCF